MKTRVLIIHHGGAHGGAAISLAEMLRRLDPAEFDCQVCAALPSPETEAFFQQAGFATTSCRLRPFSHTTTWGFDPWNQLGRAEIRDWIRDYVPGQQRLAELLGTVKPDIVHFNSFVLAPFVRVARRMGIPTIVHVRDKVLTGMMGIRKRWIQQQLAIYADRVIFICQDNMDDFTLPAGKAVVIYNPVDLGRFSPTIDRDHVRTSLGIPTAAHVVCYAGGSHLAKGPRAFFEAANLVARAHPVTWLLPGFTPPRHFGRTPWRHALAAALYPGHAHYVDDVANVFAQGAALTPPFTLRMEDCLAASDVVCVTHIRPHFARLVMEAGAVRRPVIAFRVGGVAEVVAHERTGLLVPPGDSQRLAEAILRLLGDPELADRLAEGGLRQALVKFDAQRSADAVAQVYRDVLSVRRANLNRVHPLGTP